MTATPERRPYETSPLAKFTGVLGLLFFLLAFVGQACHSHSLPPAGTAVVGHTGIPAAGVSLLGSNTDHPSTLLADTAETCPLCVVMHSATPASAHAVVRIAPVRALTLSEDRDVHCDEPVTFARLSRPPPTLSRAA